MCYTQVPNKTKFMKLKTIHICEKCSYQSSKWAGKCPECGAWNSFVEDVISNEEVKKDRVQRTIKAPSITRLTQEATPKERLSTNIAELDRVLGGGIVEGSVILLGGEPGIGKSTLTLQLAAHLTKGNQKVLLISGEESVSQIARRAERLKIKNENLFLLNETLLESILAALRAEKPDFAIIDSIQVIASSEITGLQGGVTQVRACTEELMTFAKESGTPLLIISHVTKGGNLAGPKTLEHLVDTVLYLEGDRYHDLRLIRGVKNRFGSTNEVGLFEMTGSGLKEVPDPTKAFLENRQEKPIGSCLTVTIEGSRPLIIEIQALTNKTHFGYPQRTTSGFDLNRLQLLIAILQKHANIDLSQHDVYVNVVGGLKIKDPAIDLAVCLAILSSHKKFPLPQDLVAFGELGLSGEIRKGFRFSDREKIAKKANLAPLSLQNLLHQVISGLTK